jgi:hypothetical protein
MIAFQPLLIVVLLGILGTYMLRFRSLLRNRLIVMFFCAASVFFVLDPELTNTIAHKVGISRGADLIFYLALPGLLFMILLLYAKVLEQEQKIIRLTREVALQTADDRTSK